MIRVQTPSRLHFGLIAPGPGAGPRFGGAGLMVDSPGTVVVVELAENWRITGVAAFQARAAQVTRLLREEPSLGTLQPCHVHVQAAPPLHVGLGTGTQLALAVAHGVLASQGMAIADPVSLAMLAGRAPRSGIGIHGFFHGGFLVDRGKENAASVAPLVQRCPFPDAWRVVLLRPEGPPGISGECEREAFARLTAAEAEAGADRRRRLVEQALVPALRREDFDGFAEALYEYNRLAGEAFASVQGGPYASPALADAVARLRGRGVKGVGQSSWGPTVFAIARDEEEARALAQWVMETTPPGQSIVVTRACNHGAVTSSLSP